MSHIPFMRGTIGTNKTITRFHIYMYTVLFITIYKYSVIPKIKITCNIDSYVNNRVREKGRNTFFFFLTPAIENVCLNLGHYNPSPIPLKHHSSSTNCRQKSAEDCSAPLHHLNQHPVTPQPVRSKPFPSAIAAITATIDIRKQCLSANFPSALFPQYHR